MTFTDKFSRKSAENQPIIPIAETQLEKNRLVEPQPKKISQTEFCDEGHRDSGDPLYLTGDMVHFGYYKIN